MSSNGIHQYFSPSNPFYSIDHLRTRSEHQIPCISTAPGHNRSRSRVPTDPQEEQVSSPVPFILASSINYLKLDNLQAPFADVLSAAELFENDDVSVDNDTDTAVNEKNLGKKTESNKETSEDKDKKISGVTFLSSVGVAPSNVCSADDSSLTFIEEDWQKNAPIRKIKLATRKGTPAPKRCPVDWEDNDEDEDEVTTDSDNEYIESENEDFETKIESNETNFALYGNDGFLYFSQPPMQIGMDITNNENNCEHINDSQFMISSCSNVHNYINHSVRQTVLFSQQGEFRRESPPLRSQDPIETLRTAKSMKSCLKHDGILHQNNDMHKNCVDNDQNQNEKPNDNMKVDFIPDLTGLEGTPPVLSNWDDLGRAKSRKLGLKMRRATPFKTKSFRRKKEIAENNQEQLQEMALEE